MKNKRIGYGILAIVCLVVSLLSILGIISLYGILPAPTDEQGRLITGGIVFLGILLLCSIIGLFIFLFFTFVGDDY